MKTKILIPVVVCVIIGLSFLFYISFISKIYTGVSSDEKWEAEFKRDIFYNHKNNWVGQVRWRGDKLAEDELEVTFLQLTKNGEYYSGDTKLGTIHVPQEDQDTYIFAEYGGPPEENDKLEVLIKWEERGTEFSERIKLK